MFFYWQNKKKTDGLHPQVQVKDDGSYKGIDVELQQYNTLVILPSL